MSRPESTPNFVQVPPDPIQLEAYQWAIDWVSGIDPMPGFSSIAIGPGFGPSATTP
jgi:hypothetical protein